MFSTLLLGLLLGLQHALEADHLAAVASLSTRSGSLRDAALQGMAWGLGHSLTLLAFGGALLLADLTLTPWAANGLELLVGLMLVLLGADVLRRLWRQRVHFHVHSHGAQRHVHAHSHARDSDHATDPHRHRHASALPRRALLVGMTHGLAGTAALLVFALGSVDSALQGLLNIAVFGVGSILGMVALAVTISLPLRWSAQRLTWTHNSLTLLFGVLTIGLGILVTERAGGALWLVVSGA